MEALRHKSDADSVALFDELKEKHVALLLQEEDYWWQRAKNFWLINEDANTKYFHSKGFERRKINNIQKLRNDANVWVEDVDGLCELAKQYFMDLFFTSMGCYEPVFGVLEHKVTDHDNDLLLAPFSLDEFSIATFQTHPDKAPGPDGLNPSFYQ
ncbi:hypothetical protein PTKIN_Ptkin03bG0103200 [Pterospermum kingtungense]